MLNRKTTSNLSIRDYIKSHEGFRDSVYNDTSGVPTIGWGHNLHKKLSKNILERIFEFDLEEAYSSVYDTVGPISMQDGYRYIAIVDMMFNLGQNKFSEFKKMIEAIKNKDWEKAADEALNSRWARQVGIRAVNDAYMLRYNRPVDRQSLSS